MKHFNVNLKCEEKLGNLGDAIFEDFVRCRGNELTSFLFVRDLTICVSKLPKKGKAANAEAGLDVLILRAFSAQTELVLLKDPTQEEQETEQDTSSEPVPAHRVAKIIEVWTGPPRWRCNQQALAMLLDNKDWIIGVKFCFDPQGKQKVW
jgi:hypothetical protein